MPVLCWKVTFLEKDSVENTCHAANSGNVFIAWPKQVGG